MRKPTKVTKPTITADRASSWKEAAMSSGTVRPPIIVSSPPEIQVKAVTT
jgi:hypothetical protein